MNFFRKKAQIGKADQNGASRSETPPLHLLALEPRIVYDAAGLATVTDDGASKEPVVADMHHDNPHDSFESGLGQTLAAFKSLAAPVAEVPTREPAMAGPAEAPPPEPTAILFVDSRVENYQQLTGGLDAGVKVVVLSSGEDGLNQITRELAQRENLNAVHIVSHGDSGKLNLGGTELTLDTMNAKAEHFRLWSTAMNERADLLLYGCDVASGPDGQNFIQRLSELTGADVAASTDKTGAAAMGGDWDLEEKAGVVETGVFASRAVQAEWLGTLNEIQLVSVNSGEGQTDNISDRSSVSADGRFVAFRSSATNLVAGDTNGMGDIFVRDQQTGTTTRVSVDSSGTEGDGASYSPSISADGRFVTFYSYAGNLVAGDTNLVADVFVHDQLTGTTTRVSVDSSGTEANGSSDAPPSISADGRYVVFSSFATNLVAGDTNAMKDVFLRDRVTGITTRISVDSIGNQGNGQSETASISMNGRYVAFSSSASNLVAGDANSNADIFVRDTVNGTTTRVSLDSSGAEGNNASGAPSISANGRFVVFESLASNLVAGDANGMSDVFVHDRISGDTCRVSVDSSGAEGNGASNMPSISEDGRFVVYHSFASNMVANDTNGNADVFIHDRMTGFTSRLSANAAGTEGNSGSWTPSISADGRFVAFYSGADNLVAGDANIVNDVFLADLNDAPKVNNFGKATLNAIMQDSGAGLGTAAGDIVRPVFKDADEPGHLAIPGMAVTGVDNTNGTWEYSLDHGASWTPFAGLSAASATLLSGEVQMTTQPITSATDIAASQLFINNSPTTAIIMSNPLQHGLNMEGAWNIMEAVNNTGQTLMADVSNLWSSNVAATIGTSTDVEFFLNGTFISFTTSGASVGQVLADTMAAINLQKNFTGIDAYAGNGTNGGTADAIVLQNVAPGCKRPISITGYSETGTATTGLANVFQLADSTHNTGQVTFFGMGRSLVSTSAGNDSILSIIGLGGGSACTGQPGDTAGDGKIMVCSGPDRIRFVPDAGYSGAADITFKLWDHTGPNMASGNTGVDASAGGGSTSFSTDAAMAKISVNPLGTDNVVRNGAEFLVNSETASNEYSPTATALAGGDYVLSWNSSGLGGTYGLIHDAAGNPQGTEFLIATSPDVDITGLNNGGFLAVYAADDLSGNGIFGQRFDNAGNQDGGSFQINTYATGDQGAPVAASLADGGFAVVWQSDVQDSSGYGVYGLIYDAQANAKVEEFQVNTFAANDQSEPSIAGLNDGGFVVTWSTNGADGSLFGVAAQRFNAMGAPVGQEFIVNTSTTGDQYCSKVAGLADGGFVVAWEDANNQDGSGNGIHAQRYDANGSPAGGEFQINTYTTGNQEDVALAGLADGGFIMTWTSAAQDGSGKGVYGNRFDPLGNMVGNEFQVNVNTLSDQYEPVITGCADGSFLVAWTSDGQDGAGLGVYAQRFGVNLAPVLDNSGNMQLASLPEDAINAPGNTVGDIIASAGGDRITDPNNNGLEGIAVTAADNTNGVWEYSLDAGAAWCPVDDGSLGTGHALLLDSSDPAQRIRFTPNPDWNGSASLAFHAWDKSIGTAGGHADASMTGGASAFSILSDTVDVVVTPVNDAPTLSGAVASSYTVDDPAIVVDSGIVVADVDNVNLQSATVTINAGYIQGYDVLSCTPAVGLTASWDADTASLLITGSGTVADYQATLQSVLFASLGAASPAGERSVSFQVNDGALTSAVATSTISVSVAPPSPPPVEPPPVETPPDETPPPEPPPVETLPDEPPPAETPAGEPSPADSPAVKPPPLVIPPPDAGATKTDVPTMEQLAPEPSFMLFQPDSVSGPGLMSWNSGADTDTSLAQTFTSGPESLVGKDPIAFFSDLTRADDPFAISGTPESTANEPQPTGEGTSAADSLAQSPENTQQLPGQEGEKAAEEIMEKKPAVDEKMAEEETASEETVADEGAETPEETAEAKPPAATGEAASTTVVKSQVKDQKTSGKPGEIQHPAAEAEKSQAERSEILKVLDEVYKLTQCN